MKNKKYGVRRFAERGTRPDCFELYEVATGECASFPGTRKDLERYAKQENAKLAEEGCFELNDLAFQIKLTQQRKNAFTVTYGKQVKSSLSYDDAALELGAAIMHALACDGKLDNE